jgi:hypothetical protein
MDNILSSLSCSCICTMRHFYLPICSFHFMLPSTAQFNLVYFVSSPSAPSQPKFFFLSVATWISVSLFLPSDLIQLLFRFSCKKFLAFISCTLLFFHFLHLSVLHSGFFLFCRLVYFTFSGVLFVLSRLCLMSFFVASKVPLFPFCPNVYFIRVTSIRFQFAFSLPGFDPCFLLFQSRQP